MTGKQIHTLTGEEVHISTGKEVATSIGKGIPALTTIHDISLAGIISHLNFAERFALAFTCHYLHSWLQRKILPNGDNNSFEVELERYISGTSRFAKQGEQGQYADDAKGLLNLCRLAGSHIFGSTILQCLLGVHWQKSDLDIMCELVTPVIAGSELGTPTVSGSELVAPIAGSELDTPVMAASSLATLPHQPTVESKTDSWCMSPQAKLDQFSEGIHGLWTIEELQKRDNFIPLRLARWDRELKHEDIIGNCYIPGREDRLHSGYETHDDSNFNPFAHELLQDSYSIFPLLNAKFKRHPHAIREQGGVIDFSVITSQSRHKSVSSLLRRIHDFSFLCATWDCSKQGLQVLDWNAIWSKECVCRVRSIEFCPLTKLTREGYKPMHTEAEILSRVHGRRIKYEERGFKIRITDEELIMRDFIISTGRSIVDVDATGLPPWPSRVHDTGENNEKRPWFVSRSPNTGSLYFSPYAKFPWAVKPISPKLWTHPANGETHTHTPFPMKNMILWQ